MRQSHCSNPFTRHMRHLTTMTLHCETQVRRHNGQPRQQRWGIQTSLPRNGGQARHWQATSTATVGKRRRRPVTGLQHRRPVMGVEHSATRLCQRTALRNRLNWIEQGLTSHSTHFRSFQRRWGDCGISQYYSRSQSQQCVRC